VSVLRIWFGCICRSRTFLWVFAGSKAFRSLHLHCIYRCSNANNYSLYIHIHEQGPLKRLNFLIILALIISIVIVSYARDIDSCPEVPTNNDDASHPSFRIFLGVTLGGDRLLMPGDVSPIYTGPHDSDELEGVLVEGQDSTSDDEIVLADNSEEWGFEDDEDNAFYWQDFEPDEDEDEMRVGLHDLNTLTHLYRFGLLNTGKSN